MEIPRKTWKIPKTFHSSSKIEMKEIDLGLEPLVTQHGETWLHALKMADCDFIGMLQKPLKDKIYNTREVQDHREVHINRNGVG